jgi:hypothetical protein
MSARDLLLGAVELPRETVPVPELGLGTTFTLQCMSGEKRDAFELSLTALTANQKRRLPDPTNYRAKLLVFSIIDPETGELVFTPNDIPAVGKIRADVLSRLADVAQRLSGIRREDVEDAEKN